MCEVCERVEGVDMHAHLFIDHRDTSIFSRVEFSGWFRPQNYFNSKIFLIHGIYAKKISNVHAHTLEQQPYCAYETCVVPHAV